MMLLLYRGSDSGVIVACTVMGGALASTGSKPDIGEYISFSLQRWRWECRWGKWMLYLGTFDILCRMASPKLASLAGMDSGCSRVSAALGSLSQDSGE